MNEIVDVLQRLNQDQAVVALFAGILIVAVLVVAASTILRFMGKWGIVATALAIAAVAIAYRVAR